MRYIKKSTGFFAMLLAAVLLCAGCAASSVAGAGEAQSAQSAGTIEGSLTEEQARDALAERYATADVTVREPSIDLSEVTEAEGALPDIDAYPLSVEGTGDIDVEIFSSTEKAGTDRNGWLSDMARAFNEQGNVIDGKTVSVSIRAVTSGLATEYIVSGAAVPDAFTPSNRLWEEMIEAQAPQLGIECVCERLCGNTAGVIMDPDSYARFIQKYEVVTAKTVAEAVIAGDLAFDYTSPYVSSTGLNFLTQVLKGFDPDDPLSFTAKRRFAAFQAGIPAAAATTEQIVTNVTGETTAAVMESQASSGVDSMKDFVFTPMGVRHDSPLYVFAGTGAEKRAVVERFRDFCLTDEAQAAATADGFNANLSFEEQDPGMTGEQLEEAQNLWNASKDGAERTAAVFVADLCGADEAQVQQVKDVLSGAQKYILDRSYVGLVSCSDAAYIDVRPAAFTGSQPLAFSWQVQSLAAEGDGTGQADAMIAALSLVESVKEEIGDGVKPMVIVLAPQETGWDTEEARAIAEGLGIAIQVVPLDEAGVDARYWIRDVMNHA
jgi:Ca-activated chloride channel family protein